MTSYLKTLFNKFVSVEEESYKMYKKFEEFAKTRQLKNLFDLLAKEELKHKTLFLNSDIAKIMISNEEKLEKIKVSDFARGEISLKDKDDLLDAIEMAIKLEQDSYDTYMKFAKLMEDDEEKFAVIEVANQELRHKEKLILAKNDLLGE